MTMGHHVNWQIIHQKDSVFFSAIFLFVIDEGWKVHDVSQDKEVKLSRRDYLEDEVPFKPLEAFGYVYRIFLVFPWFLPVTGSETGFVAPCRQRDQQSESWQRRSEALEFGTDGGFHCKPFSFSLLINCKELIWTTGLLTSRSSFENSLQNLKNG